MIEPLKVTRQKFPKSTVTVQGMKVLKLKPDNYELYYHSDVKYVERPERDLYLQIIEPIGGERLPMVVFVPGSAFYKQDVKGRVAQLSMLAMRGYVVALLEYRGSEDAAFPGFVLDAKAGVLYMKEHAERYHGDPNKMFVMGDSSGGYTALMTGLTLGVDSLEDEISRGKDYSVKGVIDFYGPTDFTTMNEEPSIQDHRVPESPEGCAIGKNHVIERRDLSEPTIIKNYVADGRKLPPVIMFHGSNDELVPFGQSCQLYEALVANGHEASLYQMEGAHHGEREFWSSAMLDMLEEFMKQAMNKASND
ncbi:MAG: alpha/beta hydrolase [Lachnospiraceae bacterium]|nr:alpha/beta hydrolase [Lachnospiraceae bacterium]